jgi:ankyrin repeat protein
MLMAAVRGGSADAVAALLKHGAEVDTPEPHFQQTALMIAVREDHPDIVKLLIDHKADVNAQTRLGDVPKFRLPSSNRGSHGTGIVRGGWPARGMRNPASGLMTPLLYAARDGHLKSAEMLVAAGADIERPEANELTPLVMAITNGNFDVAQFLIEHNAKINAADFYGQTPLWAAIDVRDLNVDGNTRDNHVDREAAFKLIQTLLDKGADPNARVKEVPPGRRWLTPLGSLEWVDFTGQTPFIRAAVSGDVEVMKLLLKYHADPNLMTNSNTTALMAAAGINWVVNQTYDEGPDKLLEAVKMCVELGQDVNAVNTMGLAAIHGAANRGSDKIIEYLVSKGARLDVADKEGRTPLTWAQGVFLASVTAEPKPSTIALIKRLTGEASAEPSGDKQTAAR